MGLGIRNRDFDVLVQDLGKSMNKFTAPARGRKEFVALPARCARTSSNVNLTHS